MSFREKSAWISFITILLVFGAYFWNVARIVAANVGGHAGFVISISLIGASSSRDRAAHHSDAAVA
jgi:hypothetical protein